MSIKYSGDSIIWVLREIEFHDQSVLKMEVDFTKSTIRFQIEPYIEEINDYKAGVLEFINVTQIEWSDTNYKNYQFDEIVDLECVKDNNKYLATIILLGGHCAELIIKIHFESIELDWPKV